MKLWSIAEIKETETEIKIAICRFGGMENSEVGPWNMVAIFKSKREANRALEAFKSRGYSGVRLVPLQVKDMIGAEL